MSVSSEIDLRRDDLAVATVIDMMQHEGQGVRRTALQSFFALATDMPKFDDLELPDLERLSNALLHLRVRGLAVLNDQGFQLTDSGAEFVGDHRAREIAERLTELRETVRRDEMLSV